MASVSDDANAPNASGEADGAASGPEGRSGAINLAGMIDESRILDLDATGKDEALERLIEALATAPQVTDPKALREGILEREHTLSTGVGIGVAIPHVRLASVKEFVIAIGRLGRGIDFGSLDRMPVRLIVMIAVPERQAREYLNVVAALLKRLKEDATRRRIMFARTPKEIKAALVEASEDA